MRLLTIVTSVGLLISVCCSREAVAGGRVCPSEAEQVRLAAFARGRQVDLLRSSVPEMDTEVPAEVQQRIEVLKAALTTAVDAALACDGDMTDGQIQGALARSLGANQPERPYVPKPPGSTLGRALDAEVYGGDLKVAVTRPAGVPRLITVQVSFRVECGDDTMLLMYKQAIDGWGRVLRYQSPKYKEVSGAFGDFFVFQVLPGLRPEMWKIVVAHGTPWCTSRFSGFAIDVLAATADQDTPRVVWHTQRGYSRGDFQTRLRTTGDGFELRLNVPALDPNSYERTVVYRYRVNGDTLTRVEPIATNGRGFVEEWLAMPWDEAEAQTAAGAETGMRRAHEQFARGQTTAGSYTSHSDGPVRACSTAKVYQVEIDAEPNTAGAGGQGIAQAAAALFFRIRETGTGYEMVSAGSGPDPGCAGRDLMPPRS